MASIIFSTRFAEKIPRAGDIVSFRFGRPDDYRYTAGQWHVVTIPATPEPLTHHFTHSSSPTEPYLEFTTRMRGTEFKNALAALAPGTLVQMEGPYGTFTLDAAMSDGAAAAIRGAQESRRRPLVFITGGIGITPVRSILRWQMDSGVAWPAVLLYTNSGEDAIAFREELDTMAEALPDLKVVYVVSRPSPAWIGRQGHIDAGMLAEELDDIAAPLYYVSGPPSMVQSLRDILVGQGVDRESIKTERFEGYE